MVRTNCVKDISPIYLINLFNKEENWNYVGPIPCQNDYNVNFMKPEERKAFIAWHKEQVESNYLFDFQKEIVKYCRSDVDIMRKCCLLFREMLREETHIDPFGKSLTITSYCHEVYRTNFLKEDTIAIFTHDTGDVPMPQSYSTSVRATRKSSKNHIVLE